MLNMNVIKKIISYNPDYSIKLNGQYAEFKDMGSYICAIPSSMNSGVDISILPNKLIMGSVDNKLLNIKNVKVFDVRNTIELYT